MHVVDSVEVIEGDPSFNNSKDDQGADASKSHRV
jgi:hypothetical protein